MKNAPVVVFAYRRPDHLRSTLDSLLKCDCFDSTPVHIYFDGPRNRDEREAVELTRKLAQNMLGDHAKYHYNESNKGLSNSIIDGVTEILNRYGSAIIVEDDLVLQPQFLSYMNQALEQYSDCESVFQVSGYMFDVPEINAQDKAFFLPFTVSWGWATWQRAWRSFDSQATGWEMLKTDQQLRKRFNLDNAYDYATMLERQMQGQRDSWAIRWYWSVFRANGLVLFPPKSFVGNMGFDGSGTHGRGVLSRFSNEQLATPEVKVLLPESVRLNERMYKLVSRGISKQSGGWIARIVGIVRQILNR